MILIADSGGTKTTWVCLHEGTAKATPSLYPVETRGTNPIRDDASTLTAAIAEGAQALQAQASSHPAAPFDADQITALYFYGAGCIAPYSKQLHDLLQAHYPHAHITVDSDMLGAAIALCGHSKGVACILGTGSNSCLFDGKHIVQQTPALGFILGDEGGGASLGKRLVGDVLKGQLPTEIQQAFWAETLLTQADIIERVYRQPQPNAFLASLTPFLAAHQEHPAIRTLLVKEFRRFLQRNVRNYRQPELPVHFVGGLTHTFLSPLSEAVALEGLKMGQVLARPIQGMVAYHLTDRSITASPHP